MAFHVIGPDNSSNPKNMLVMCPRCMHCEVSTTLSVSADGVKAYREGAFAQVAFPTLSADEREMLISGTHPSCWTAMFGSEDEE